MSSKRPTLQVPSLNCVVPENIHTLHPLSPHHGRHFGLHPRTTLEFPFQWVLLLPTLPLGMSPSLKTLKKIKSSYFSSSKHGLLEQTQCYW